ncbi:MAG: hypothetical protein AAGF97_12180, partial [Planctomycetota bacterium]
RLDMQLLRIAGCIVLMGTTATHAATYTWDQPNGWRFFDQNNWAPQGIPSATDTARFIMEADYTVELLTGRTVNDFVFSRDAEVTFYSSPAVPFNRTVRAQDVLMDDQQFHLILQPGSAESNLNFLVENTFDMTGSFSVFDGAQVQSAVTRVAGSGRVLVQGGSSLGIPTFWSAGELDVETGIFDVLDGAVVGNEAAIVHNAIVNVVGHGSSWATGGTLDLGTTTNLGSLMNVRAGARLAAQDMRLGPVVGTGGGGLLVESDQPAHRSTLVVSHDVHVGGTANGSASSGRLTIGNHADADVLGTISIWSLGVVAVHETGTLNAGIIENNAGGAFDFLGGRLQVARFEGDLLNQGGVVAPGPDAATMHVLGDFTQQPPARLQMELAGSQLHDVVDVQGTAALAGQLELTLIEGFVPTVNDQLTILTAASLQGGFANVADGERLQTTDGGGSFQVNYGLGSAFGANQLVLSHFMSNLISPDFNGDGNTDGADIDALVAEIVAATDPTAFDLTGDGVVDQADLQQWLVEAGAINLPSGNPYLVGDANLDGQVDGQDFIAWNGSKFTPTAAWTAGDFNADGQVDGQDFIAWNGNKFSTVDARLAAVPEPLPAAWLLLAGGLATVRRKRGAK